jgi:hypothetical protein
MSDLTNRSLESFAYPPPTNQPPTSRLGAVFLLNPANRQFLAGEREFATQPRRIGCVLTFVIPLLLLGIGFLVWAGQTFAQWDMLNNRSGLSTIAEITAKNSTESGGYFIRYRFADPSNTYFHEQRVTSDLYDRAQVGAKVRIVYLPQDPGTAALAGPSNPPWFPLAFALCWNFFVWSLFVLLAREMWSEYLLKRQGYVVSGEVAMSAGLLDSDGDFSLILDYAFRSPRTGQIIKGTARQMRNDLIYEVLPAPGAPIAVLYRKDQHHQPL